MFPRNMALKMTFTSSSTFWAEFERLQSWPFMHEKKKKAKISFWYARAIWILYIYDAEVFKTKQNQK